MRQFDSRFYCAVPRLSQLPLIIGTAARLSISYRYFWHKKECVPVQLGTQDADSQCQVIMTSFTWP